MRITPFILMALFAVAAANAETIADQRFVAEVEQSDVNFVYASDGKMTIVKTNDTAEAVDALMAKKPTGLDVTVVTYTTTVTRSETGDRETGFKLEYE